MIPELGLACLILALAVALLQALPLAVRGVPRLSPTLPLLQCVLAAFALLMLMLCRITSDFTVANVVSASNRSLPLLYKIIGSWGNHEGSMVLVVLVLSLYAALLARRHPEQQQALAVQGLLATAFLAFIVLTSSPFARIFPPPEDGDALNPLLQDVAMSIHPPMLYLGYMGFSIVFALAAGAMLCGRLDRAWAQMAHPWILAAWSFLTAGITLGSWWAYRVLGWGGYWFWDPVENASLLPWLAGTALLHANLALMKRGALAHWVLLLSILAFAMSLLGTFLVRSGAVTSVHSFASDPTRGIWLIVFFVLFIGGALLLYTVRAPRIVSENTALPLSREGLIVWNGLIFTLALAIILLGTLYPLLSEWFWHRPVSVGAPYFNRTALPVLASALLLAALAPLVAWQQDAGKRVVKQLAVPLAAAGVAALIVLAFASRAAATASCGFALSAWLIAGTLRYARQEGGGRAPVVLAHLGAAVLAAGITGMAAWQLEVQQTVQTGDSFAVDGYRVKLAEVAGLRRQNHVSRQARLEVADGEHPVATLLPEYRVYDIAGTSVSTPAIAHRWWGDLYAVINGAPQDAAVGLRVYINPLSSLLWLGGLMMASGGLLSVWQRRR